MRLEVLVELLIVVVEHEAVRVLEDERVRVVLEGVDQVRPAGPRPMVEPVLLHGLGQRREECAGDEVLYSPQYSHPFVVPPVAFGAVPSWGPYWSLQSSAA